MRTRKPFLRWVVLMSLTAVGVVISYRMGWIGLCWRFDATRITFVIMALFVAASAKCGTLVWKAGDLNERIRLATGTKNLLTPQIAEIDSDKELGWLAHDFCEKLGLLGTLVGLVMVLVKFAEHKAGGDDAITKLMGEMATGLGTAYLTTIVGLVCSMILAMQLKLLERIMESVRAEADKS